MRPACRLVFGMSVLYWTTARRHPGATRRHAVERALWATPPTVWQNSYYWATRCAPLRHSIG
jgi:hypothetical protein